MKWHCVLLEKMRKPMPYLKSSIKKTGSNKKCSFRKQL
jgi:hypothetical protein